MIRKKGNLRSRRYSPCPPPSSLGNGPTQDTLSTRSRSLSFTKTLPSQVLRNVKNQHISPHVYCPLVTLIKQTAFRCIFLPNFPDTRRESRASTEASSGGGYRQPTVMRNACLPVVTTTRDKQMKLSIKEAAVAVLLASTAPTKPQREREKKKKRASSECLPKKTNTHTLSSVLEGATLSIPQTGTCTRIT